MNISGMNPCGEEAACDVAAGADAVFYTDASCVVDMRCCRSPLIYSKALVMS